MAPIQTCNLSPEDITRYPESVPSFVPFWPGTGTNCLSTPTFSQTKRSPGEPSQEPEQGLPDPENHIKLYSEEIKELGHVSQHPEILFYCQAANGHW